ncbi:MAG TPA: L-aspartate oxidase [Oculatellaceae cyanobacterium]
MVSGKKIIDADVLVVGSGLAGLLASVKLAQQSNLRVVLVSKAGLPDSNSSFAQGGLAAVAGTNPFDSPNEHLFDTLKSGAGLCDEFAARDIVFGGAQLIEELSKLGVLFDREPSGRLSLALEGGHSKPRVLHSKDTTGRAITSALSEEVRRLGATRSNFRVFEHTCVMDLLMVDGVCAGAKLLGTAGEHCVLAPCTVLATGGAGQVFARTTNPSIATADGVALAYRAGAKLKDMEFMQFHPTALRLDGAPAFLISEAVRGAGAILLDRNGSRFVTRFHADGELATRDIVARAIHTVMHEYGSDSVHLDLRPIGTAAIAEKFPNIVATCAEHGIDVFTTPIPVAPAAHYMMGGIEATVDGRTSVEGLYAIGECACTGLHGANRLASNSLLEAGVMAVNLAHDICKSVHALSVAVRRSAFTSALCSHIVELPENLESFQSRMYRNAGIVRSSIGLSMILQEPSITIRERLTPAQFAANNIFQVGKLMALSALARRESRGAHLREDFPGMDSKNFARHYVISRESCYWQDRRRAQRLNEHYSILGQGQDSAHDKVLA